MQRHGIHTEGDAGFNRVLGLFSSMSIIGGIMIGSGIFYIGSYVLKRVDFSPSMALLAWIIGGIVSLLGGLCYAELGASLPKTGGSTVYLNEAYHPIVGFMSGFTSWVLSGAGSIAAIALAFAVMIKGFVPMGDVMVKALAILMIFILTFINYRGIKLGAVLQNVTMVAKLAPIVIILVAGLLLGKVPVSEVLSHGMVSGTPSISRLLGMIAFAVLATLWAYEGWTNLNPVAEEIKNPRKNLPRAIVFAIGGIALIYTLFNLAIYRVIPMGEVITSIEQDKLYLGTETAFRLLGQAGTVLVAIGMIISILGSLNGCILAFPRVYYAMGEEGHFFKSFARLHPTYRTPGTAIIVQAFISSALVLLRNLDQLTSLVVFCSMLFTVLVVFSVLVLRRKYPDLERPYKVIGGQFTIYLTILIFLALLVNTFISDPMTSVIGLIVPAVGAVVYLLFDRFQVRKEQA